jgi:hypothetical protein
MSMEAFSWACTRKLRVYNKMPLIMLATSCGMGPEPEMMIHTDYDPENLAAQCGMTSEEIHIALNNLVNRKLIEIRKGQFVMGIWDETAGHTVVLNVSKEHRI